MKITLLLLFYNSSCLFNLICKYFKQYINGLEKERSDGIAVILNNNFSENSVKERIPEIYRYRG
ncbi:MAG: hypothetical protein R3A12_13965 [Ignavibacteria bacterium]